MVAPRISLAVTLLLSLCSPAFADPYKRDVGPAKVEQHDETWHDAKRDRDVPVRLYLPADASTASPVILISHGLGGTRAAMAYVATHWCSYGYVVVALQHPGSDDGVWRDAGTPRERIAAMRDAANARNYVLRCDDVHFAIDHLADLAKPGQALAGKVDLTKIGAAGHSFGAQTVQALAGQRLGAPRVPLPSHRDDRIRAAVAFSPGFSHNDPDWAFGDVNIPIFHFTGTRDTVALVSDMTVEQRRIPFDNIHAAGQRLVTFDGGDHMVFSGSSLPDTDTERYDHFHDLIRQSTTAFWDSELKGDPKAKAWLDDSLAEEVGHSGKVETHD